ncbi:MAG: hypothetical protein HYZ15_06500 [Sphingobacteriales bacterium]|nr:hypothetical protein [Sphingobacteriales bacterium]
MDPVFKEYESPYATFGNSPIWNIDNAGADTAKYLSNTQLLDAVKLARKNAQVIAQTEGANYNDKANQEKVIQEAKEYAIKNKLTINEALEFQTTARDYFRLYYWQWSWSKNSRAILAADWEGFSNPNISDPFKIGIQVYTIRLYENKHRALKGAAGAYAGILMSYLPVNGLKLAKVREYPLGNAIDIRNSSFKSMGTISAQIKNEGMLGALKAQRSNGTWIKVYDAGYLNGGKVEIHYFLHKETGLYFDSKIKQMGWSKQFLKGKNKIIE